MDENLARLNKIYPNGQYVLIAPYNPELWKDRDYDSSLDNKAALNKWKTKPLSYAEAQQYVSEGKRIGWVIPQGMVVVDIDNVDDPRSQEYLEKLLQKWEVKYSYNYTSRGMHILLKDPSEKIKSESHIKCALNITIDTRANGTGYIILPCNDPHRAWGEWNDYVEEIPYFLIPALKDDTPSFIGMVNGDGRNDVLFKWRTKLEITHKFTEKQIENSIRAINEYIFDEPMPNNELFKTVLRSREKEAKPNAAEKQNIYNELADKLIGQNDIISFYDNFYSFNGIYYKPLNEIEVEKLIHYELSKNIPKAGRREIIEFIKIKTQVKPEDFDKDWYKIACKNGILNLVTGELESPNKSDINTIFIPHEYNPDPVYSPRIDNFMCDITGNDPIKMQFLYQIAGYCLLKKNLFEKFFIIQGEGGTGKSTYQKLLQRMVGDQNCAHVGLAELDKDYYLANLVSKLLNLDDDVVDGKFLENTGRFKSIVSGNMISVRQIYAAVMDFVPYATLIFNCNKLPKIMDKTSGLYRRLILVELNEKISNPDPLFDTKITEEDIEYFLYKAVEGIKIAIEEGKFKVTQSDARLLDVFRRRQSPLNEWLYENDIRLGDLHNKRCMSLYRQFVEWCANNGYSKPCTNFTFKEDICTLFDVEQSYEQIGETKGTTQVFYKRGDFDPNYKPF